MAKAFLAPSLVQFRSQINSRWPGRDKTSDGWIGDARHQARKSEHNPDGRGCVHAIDVDRTGIDPRLVVAAAIADPRTWYVIFNRRIYSRQFGFRARAYHGANPHDKHIHVSILLTSSAETNASPWRLGHGGVVAPVNAGRLAVPPFPGRLLVFSSVAGFQRLHGSDVRTWQARMRTIGRGIDVDGWYGPHSAQVATAFQRDRRLVADGIVGPKTWAASWR
jgi:hypothetical protein